MVHHHDHRIDHNTERDGHSRQRNQIQFYIEQIIENNGYQHIGKQWNGYNRKIAPAPADYPNKQEEDRQR